MGIPSRSLIAAMLAAAFALTSVQSWASPDIEQRVEELLGRMTLDEKVGQLNLLSNGVDFKREKVAAARVGAAINFAAPGEIADLQRLVRTTRLKIPLIFGLDVLHGVRTMFPVPLAEAAAFNPALSRRAAELAAREARNLGVQWTYAPMADLARDPRWGRMVEGFGEDVFLGSTLTRARVEGFRAGGLATAVKHFAGYGGGLGGRDYDATDIAPHDLRDNFLPPFRAALEAGSETVMAGFNALNGVPVTANRRLLTGILRHEWGFGGFVVSDWAGIGELINHGVAADGSEAARKAMDAGVDMDLASEIYDAHLAAEVEAGRVAKATLDESVRRVLRVKFRMGLFERPDVEERPGSGAMLPEAREVAREVARQSVVLLKNEGDVLPLKPGGSIAIIGSLAASASDQLGPHAARAREEEVVTLLSGIVERARRAGAGISFEPGCEPECADAAGFAQSVEAARRADVVIAVLGEPQFMSGEAASRATLTLPGRQAELLEALVSTGKPVVLLLVGGRPVELGSLAERVRAIAMTWFLGTEGGPAVAEILFGDVSPSGKLPVSWLRTVGQAPMPYRRLPSSRPTNVANRFTLQYLDAPITPLFPFGFGLSYTRFSYSDLSIKTDGRADGIVEVSFTLSNLGPRPAEEVAQLYVRDLVASKSRPLRELKAFERVALAAGETRRLTLRVAARDLGFHEADGTYVVEPGEFEAYVGGDSLASLSGRLLLTEGLRIPPAARP